MTRVTSCQVRPRYIRGAFVACLLTIWIRSMDLQHGAYFTATQIKSLAAFTSLGVVIGWVRARHNERSGPGEPVPLINYKIHQPVCNHQIQLGRWNRKVVKVRRCIEFTSVWCTLSPAESCFLQAPLIKIRRGRKAAWNFLSNGRVRKSC